MSRLALLLATLLAAIAVAATAASAAVQPPTAQATVTGYGGGAATVDPYATRAAIRVLRKGGNAVDAAIAAAGVLGVVEPYSSGIGGGGFMVIRSRDGSIDTIDGREFAPAAFTPTSFQENGTPIPFTEAVTSGLGVGVPGTLATWQTALQRHGTMSLKKLLEPGIEIAAKGFVVDRTLQQQTQDNAARFADFPDTANIYLPHGQPIQAGTVLQNPDLADTYRLIAKKGIGAFYGGPLAGEVADTVQHPKTAPGTTRTVRPGLMTADDLAAYRAKVRPPVRTDWRGYTVAGMGPPSSGGTTVEEALNILQAFGAPASDGAGELFRYLEASRLAYADRNQYVGDPDFVHVPTDCLISQEFADTRQALIGATALTSPVAPGDCGPAAGSASLHEGPNTTNMTVADGKGNVVEYTFTIEQTGGSGMVVPGRGFLLNNELTDFEFTTGKANSPAARKRPRSSIAPTIVLKDGKPVLALGSPGGASIITTVLQILTDRFERGMALPDAVADPRISQRNAAQTEAEQAFLDGPLRAPLEARGESFKLVPPPAIAPDSTGPRELGAATAIEFLGGGKLQVAAEPVRRGGGAAGVVTTRK
ncbi:MAG: gamma-glutamyltranspeptidase / glutathione hydrolase, partial [Solirubrobacteraceae bacterium]|nr:gamma-glutamyltranspeptidase / glutathione hydrolase [Solirubrobacteraceae bacterium]